VLAPCKFLTASIKTTSLARALGSSWLAKYLDSNEEVVVMCMPILSLYYKTLQLHNLRKIDKLHSKLVHLYKPVKLTDNYKDPLAYYATELIMPPITFMVQGPIL
jgi:hypothetical protein